MACADLTLFGYPARIHHKTVDIQLYDGGDIIYVADVPLVASLPARASMTEVPTLKPDYSKVLDALARYQERNAR